MRGRSILSEAWRNVACGTTRAGLLALIVAIVTSVLALVDVASVTVLQRQAQQFERSGAAVRTLAAEKEVSPSSCEALNRADGVLAAGALRARPAPVTLTAVSRNPIPALEVTPSLGRVLAVPGAAGSGVWVSDDLAARLGVSAGDRLPTTEGTLPIAGVFPYPRDGRDERLLYAVLIPVASARPFDECWAKSWPASSTADGLLRTALLVKTGAAKPAVLGMLNNSQGTSFDGAALLGSRPTRPVAWGAVAVALLVGLGRARARRLEYASALHAGQSRSALTAQAVAEASSWSIAGALVAAVIVAAAAVALAPSQPFVVAALNLAACACVPLAALAGTVAGTLLTRESHLFRYFKDR